jgi:hypothetical protein
MKKIYNAFFTLTLALAATTLSAQTPGWEWADASGDHGYEGANSVAMDASGNAYLTGSYTSAFIDFGTISLLNAFSGTADVCVAKYDATGAVLWAKTYGGVAGDAGTGITVDGFGNVFVTGWFTSDTIIFGSQMLLNSASASSDFFILKLDPSGNVVWAKSAGGSGNDRPWDVTTDASGNSYATGSYTSPTINFGTGTLTNAGPTQHDIFVVKYDANGTPQWSKTVGGANNDAAYGCQTDASGNIYVVGSFASASIDFGSGALTNVQTGFHDFCINKYDAAGNSLWSRSANGAYDDIAYSVAVSGANVYVTGYYNSPTLQFGTNPVLSNPGNPTLDIFVAQYSSSGVANWSNTAGGPDDDIGRCITTDALGNTYVTGYFMSTSIGFGTTTLNNCAVGTKELYVAAFNSAGTSTWSLSVGNTGDEFGYGIVSSANADMIYVGGMFNSGFVAFGANTIYKGCGDDVFLAKFGTVTSVEDGITENDFVLFPNPTRDQVMVNLVENSSVEMISLYDISGKFLMREAVNSRTRIAIDLSAYERGVYQLVIGDEAVRVVKE